MDSNALESSVRADGQAPFMGFAGDDVTRAVLRRVVGEQGWNEGQVLDGGINEAVDALAHIATPSLLVVDISDSQDPLSDIGTLAEVCDAGTRVIVLGCVNDVELYRKLMSKGVHDYLLKPVTSEAFTQALTRAAEPAPELPADQESGLGRLSVVIGARGGVGASTVAVNTAWLMTHEQDVRVALVDLDLYFGTASLMLDLEPGRGFREALENPSRMDGLFIERSMVRESENLFVLGAEVALDNAFRFEPDAVDLMIEKLRATFDCVVVDLPRGMAMICAKLLTEAQTVAIVSDPSLVGMRDTMRIAGYVGAVAPRADVKVIVNRTGTIKGGELGKGDFEKGAEVDIDYLIPLEIKPAARSATSGKPIAQVGKGTKVAAALRDLSRVFSGVDNKAKAPFWRRLLKAGG